MMRQLEHGAMIRRVLSPPATPGLIGPRTANRPEHVSSHYPGADALPESRGEIVVDARGATVLSAHALECAGRDVPIVQLLTADSERILARLARAGAIAVKGYRKVMHPYTSHGLPSIQGVT